MPIAHCGIVIDIRIFTGWLDLPARVAERDLSALQTCAATIRDHSDALVVIGTGGSYLGARAAIELLHSPQHNALHNDPQIFFVGNTLSPSALQETIDLLDGLDFSINMISKSGSTMNLHCLFVYSVNFWNENMAIRKQKNVLSLPQTPNVVRCVPWQIRWAILPSPYIQMLVDDSAFSLQWVCYRWLLQELILPLFWKVQFSPCKN